MNILDRFNKFVVVDMNTGCHNWIGNKSKDGYGKFSVKSKKVSVHRLIYSLNNGFIWKSQHVCHKCDNKACVNIDHLFLGTHKDNMADMAAKGRAKPGTPKLTPEQVVDIRNSTEKPYHLARKYKVHYNTIHRVKKNMTWNNI
jgi:hypothetical protein